MRRLALVPLLVVACTGGGERESAPTRKPPEPTAAVTQSPRALDDPKPAPFSEAVRLGATHVRLTFATGVAGCSLLDHVDVTAGGDVPSATLYVGNDLPNGVDGCSSVAAEAYAVAEVPAEPRATRIIDASRGVAVPIS
ncbi:MAG TPA: hypothetical protein VGX28_11685 [Frankiaceae bacterium]|jgi:hypothetical protein|nr:hypothetical protein [Frankiaceae bacterium]